MSKMQMWPANLIMDLDFWHNAYPLTNSKKLAGCRDKWQHVLFSSFVEDTVRTVHSKNLFCRMKVMRDYTISLKFPRFRWWRGEQKLSAMFQSIFEAGFQVHEVTLTLVIILRQISAKKETCEFEACSWIAVRDSNPVQSSPQPTEPLSHSFQLS